MYPIDISSPFICSALNRQFHSERQRPKGEGDFGLVEELELKGPDGQGHGKPGCHVVQSLSRVRLCDPRDRSTRGSPVLHYLPEFAQTQVY